MPYINVDEAYILDNTGLQVDQSVDYANANSNRNLLDNPWWGSGEVVNQRGVTQQPSSNNQYTIDRWTWNTGASANTMSLGANGITFTRSASSIWFAQKMANPSALVGKTITGSVMLSDGTIKSGSIVYASVGSTPTLYEDSNIQIYISSVGAFSLTVKTTQTIHAVKLELGSYSTLINDTPPDYGEELAKCQYYYREIKCTTTGYAMIGFATAATAFQACLPYTMRVRPSITYSGSLTAYYAGGNSAVTAVAANAEFTNSIQVAFTTTGLTAGSIVALAMGSGAKLMFSADL